ncbi:MAG: hypothetical protein WBN02_18735 [Sedimenticolaceae bacterium]
MKHLVRKSDPVMSLVLLGMAGQAAASDLFSEPVIMASVSMPLAGGTNRTARPQLGLSVSRRETAGGWRAGINHKKVIEFTAPFANPTSVSLNGVPLWGSPLERNAGPTDTELTTEEKVGTIAIVGLAIAGAAGVVVVFND